MALEDIVDRILADAREEAEGIRAAGEERVEDILDEARRRGEEIRGEIRRRGEERLAAEMRNRLSEVRMEASKRILERKHELIDAVFEQFRTGLESGTAEEHAAFLAAHLPDDLTREPARIAVGRGDLERFGPDFSRLVTDRIRSRHPGWQFDIEPPPPDLDRGLLVLAGRCRHGVSYEAILAEHRERWEPEVGRALFGS